MEKGKLIIVRHHESEWNKLGKWTGIHDASLTPHGVEMAQKMGEVIKDIKIDRAISSELRRAHRTLREMLNGSGYPDLEIERSPAINERDYGDYTGRNKWEMKDLFGEEKFNGIRREWDHPVPNGETLKIVYGRVVPFYLEEILPRVLRGENTILVAHTNSIRALVKYIEEIPNEEIKNLEIPFGLFLVYEVDDSGHMIEKEIRELK